MSSSSGNVRTGARQMFLAVFPFSLLLRDSFYWYTYMVAAGGRHLFLVRFCFMLCMRREQGAAACPCLLHYLGFCNTPHCFWRSSLHVRFMTTTLENKVL